MNGAQRLGKNINGYFGEKIEINPVLTDCIVSGQAHGWQVEEISVPTKPNLVALTRSVSRDHLRQGTNEARPTSRIYISAGIHGDEPAGPLAVRQLLQENAWPADVNLWLLPCLNPTGFRLHRRENAEGLDLNIPVISADMDFIGQMQPHTPTRFVSVDMRQALAARHDRTRMLRQLREALG